MGRWGLHRLPWTLPPVRVVSLEPGKERVRSRKAAQHSQEAPGPVTPRGTHRERGRARSRGTRR